MDEIDAILGKAKDLGAAVAAHPSCAALKEALAKLRADEAAQKLEGDYAAAARLLQEKAAAGKPLEPDDKRAEAALREQMAANDIIRAFLRAQADFQELMQKTNATLDSAIGLE